MTSELTLKDIQQTKAYAEELIYKIITKLENDTNCHVSEIGFKFDEEEVGYIGTYITLLIKDG